MSGACFLLAARAMTVRTPMGNISVSSVATFLVLLVAFVPVSSNVARKSELKQQLLAGYDSKTPPEPAGGLKVSLSIALQQFIQLNTAAETVEFSAWWRMKWIDPRLDWDDTDVAFMSFGINQIWRPDLTIYERIGGALLDTGDVTVTVYPGGNCQLSLPRSDKVGCPMAISSFPWDRQRCNFTVGSWSYTGLALDLEPQQQDVSDLLQDGELPDRLPFDLDQYKGFQEFWLARVKTIWKNTYYNLTPEPYPVLQIEFDLYRATESYVAGTFVPLILVTCIGFFTLFMPAPASGSRPALSVTVMLTTATVYFVASRGTPQSNESTSIGRIYIYSLTSSFLLVVIALLSTSLNLIQAEDKPIRQHMLDWFDKMDKEKKGEVPKEKLREGLAELGLPKAERDTVIEHFAPEEEPAVNKQQWTTLCALMDSPDDPPVYHNGLIRRLVQKSIESQLHRAAPTLGKDHPSEPAPNDPQPLAAPPPPKETSSAAVTAQGHLVFSGVDRPEPWPTPRMMTPPAAWNADLGGWPAGVPPPMSIPVNGYAFGEHGADAAAHPHPPHYSASLGQAAHKTGRLFYDHVRVIAGPPRTGRTIAARIDQIARWLLPAGFFIFVTLEFCGVVSQDYVPHGSLNPLKDSDGMQKTRLEYWDYRTSETEPRCFKNFPKTPSARNAFDAAEDECSAK